MRVIRRGRECPEGGGEREKKDERMVESGKTGNEGERVEIEWAEGSMRQREEGREKDGEWKDRE